MHLTTMSAHANNYSPKNSSEIATIGIRGRPLARGEPRGEPLQSATKIRDMR